jgi:IS5 family transposase
MKQMAFSEMRWPKARASRLQTLLADLDRSVDWIAIARALEEHFPKPGRGRQPVPLAAMIRICALAWVFSANERQIEDLLIDSPAACRFCQLADSQGRPPDAETIANFRRRLEQLGLDGRIPNAIEKDLAARGVVLTRGEVREPRWHGPRQ